MIPDAEILAEGWAKQTAALTDILRDGIATSLPEEKRMPPAFLRVVQVDVLSSVAETADVANAMLQWDAYAWKGHKVVPDWKTASLIARTLVSSLVVVSGVVIAGVGSIKGFGGIFGPKKEIEQTGWARFRVDAIMTMHP